MAQHPLSSRVCFMLILMDGTIDFDDKRCDQAEKIDDETTNHLLATKVKS